MELSLSTLIYLDFSHPWSPIVMTIYIEMNLRFDYMRFCFIRVSLVTRYLGISAKPYVKITFVFN